VRFPNARTFDRDHIDDTQAALYSLLEQSEPPQLILNLEHVDYMNSASLGALIGLSKRVRQRPGRLLLCGLTHDIRVLFDLTRLLQVFETCEDEQAALRKLEPPAA
jgi:anti-anti-sigma factor